MTINWVGACTVARLHAPKTQINEEYDSGNGPQMRPVAPNYPREATLLEVGNVFGLKRSRKSIM